MSNFETRSVPPNLLIKFSNYLRNYVNTVDSRASTIKRTYSTSSYFLTNTLSILISSTLLTPLNRLRLIMQTNSIREVNVTGIGDAISSK